ncbi:hypothetical protein ACFST9_11675 [Hymenobacter monticola]|uniref:Glycosyltransferase RgtA/B/C/D-like domain-containing protein n=1 Tax=Hymenobacter monticola TaxID=1705399 RepID=A0ABY4B7J3_9BACT|nr:hypothetical protein [Hymenobacter monticola]UOE35149.1 hypothetical protein MTP16_05735 [Hymenobacter monticola]
MRYLPWLLVYVLVVQMSLDRHRNTALNDFHNEVSGDKGGYVVYLPAAFCYQFEARRFPADLDKTLGGGFALNRATNIVETKYPYGTALLQAPFWAVAQALSADKSGFSTAVRKSIDVAGATYLVAGLMLLAATLRRRFAWWVVVPTLALLLYGTNLLYYGAIETGMSHVYSFFAFALLLWLLGRAHVAEWCHLGAGRGREVLAVAATLGLIAALRPFNLVLAAPLLLWPAQPTEALAARLRGLLHWRTVGTVVAVMAVFWLPQMLYYHYAYGSYWVYSYGQEGFPYALTPRLAEVWFAPNNGAFLYNPLLLLILGPGVWLLGWGRSWWWAGLAALLWGLASYLYAAWWAYTLGCGYGGRGFVELYPVLAWPLAALTENVLVRRRWLVAALCLVLVNYNWRLMNNFDRCFYNKGDWDWPAYRTLLNRPPA